MSGGVTGTHAVNEGSHVADDNARDLAILALQLRSARISAAAPGSATNGAVTAVPVDTADWDTGGFGGTSGRVVAPVSGKYLVSWSLNLAPNGSGTYRQAWIAKNGSDLSRFAFESPMTIGPQVWITSGADQVDLAAAEWVELHIYQDAGSDVVINSASVTLTRLAS